MKKRILIVSSLLLSTMSAFGQQDAALTHFIFNKMTFNPGSTGIDEGICASLLYRNQYDKVNGAPNTAVFNVEANLNRFFPGGLGITFAHDAIGFNRQNNFNLNYAYPLNIGGAGTLGIGLGIGLINFGLDPVWVPPNTLIDPTLPGSSSASTLDLNFGLYFKATAGFYVGLSSTHLAAPRLSQSALVGTAATNYLAARHYYGMAGYKKTVGPGDLDIQAMLRSDLVKTSVDINVRYLYNQLYGGLTYRTSDAVALMFGYMFLNKTNPNKSRINMLASYSYDLTLNKLREYSNGTHELVVKGCYFLPPPPIQKSKHPRWL